MASFRSYRPEWQGTQQQPQQESTGKPESAGYERKKPPPGSSVRRVTELNMEAAARPGFQQYSAGPEETKRDHDTSDPFNNAAHLPPGKRHKSSSGTLLQDGFPTEEAQKQPARLVDSQVEQQRRMSASNGQTTEWKTVGTSYSLFSGGAAGSTNRPVEPAAGTELHQSLPKKKKRPPISAMASLMGLSTTKGSSTRYEMEVDAHEDPKAEKEQPKEPEDSCSSEEEWEKDDQKPSASGSKERLGGLEASYSSEEEWDEGEQKPPARGGGSTTVVLCDNDVLCGKGRASSRESRPGNLRYRQLIGQRLAKFHAASKEARKEIILDIKRSVGGRFLTKHGNTYREMDEEFVKSKIYYALKKSSPTNVPGMSASSSGAQAPKKGQSESSVALPQPSPDVALVDVGSRVAVWWPDDRCYYNGTVTQRQRGPKPLKIEYDDSEVEWVNLRRQHFLLLDEEERTTRERKPTQPYSDNNPNTFTEEQKPSASDGSTTGGLMLCDNDILCGRKRDPSKDNRRANLRYRQLIEQRTAEFNVASTEKRKDIVLAILRRVGGRFLTKDGDTYQELEEEFVKRKIYNALIKAQEKLDASGSTEDIIRSPGDDDVICGQGRDRFRANHPGNQVYREIIARRQGEYLAASSERKKEIIAEVRRNFSRFLKKTDNGYYQEADESFVNDKITMAIRDQRYTKAGATSSGAQAHDGKRQAGSLVVLPEPSPDVALVHVGSRVAIWRSGAYYNGIVTEKQGISFPWKIDYDDGESVWTNLRDQHFLLLPSGQTEDAEQDSDSEDSNSDLSWASAADRKMKSNEAKAREQDAPIAQVHHEDDAPDMDIAGGRARASVSPVVAAADPRSDDAHQPGASSNQMSFVDALKEYGELNKLVGNPAYAEVEDLMRQRLNRLREIMDDRVSA